MLQSSRVSLPWAEPLRARRRFGRRLLAAGLAVVTVPASVVILAGQLGISPPGTTVVAPVMRAIDPLRSVNPYGLFAVMTTTRPEIIVEGSNDGVTWQAYEFADKVGDERRRPPASRRFNRGSTGRCGLPRSAKYDREPWFQRFLRASARGLTIGVEASRAGPVRGEGPALRSEHLLSVPVLLAPPPTSSQGLVDSRAARSVFASTILRRPASEGQRPTSDAAPSDRSAQPSR